MVGIYLCFNGDEPDSCQCGEMIQETKTEETRRGGEVNLCLECKERGD